MYGWAPRQLVNPVIIEEKQDDSHMKSLKTDCFKTVTEKSANGMIETSFSWKKKKILKPKFLNFDNGCDFCSKPALQSSG